MVLNEISYLITRGLTDLNNVHSYKFQEIHPYAPFYGSTVDEVKEFLRKFSLILNSMKLNVFIMVIVITCIAYILINGVLELSNVHGESRTKKLLESIRRKRKSRCDVT